MPFDRDIGRDEIAARIRAHPLGDDPGQMRPRFEALVLGSQTRRTQAGLDVSADGSGLRVRPTGAQRVDGPPVFWFHGGGYVFGSPETHLRPAMYLAEKHGLDIRLPRYRRAPEDRWPAPLDDAISAIGRTRNAVLAGDSAGGHLALVTALRLARLGTPPRALVLFSPNTDRSGKSRTRARFSSMDPMVSDADDARLARMMFGDVPTDDPQVSPLLDDLSLLPPTLVEVGTPEVLLDDAVLLHDHGRAQGARIDLNVTPGLLHMGQLWAPWWDEARASLDRAAAFVTATDIRRSAA